MSKSVKVEMEAKKGKMWEETYVTEEMLKVD
jgi:hypothetical protein